MQGDTAHQEKHFEAYIVQQLQKQGWQVGDTRHYDTERALYPDDLVAWLEATQPEKWAKLCKDHPADPRGALMDRLAKTLASQNAGGRWDGAGAATGLRDRRLWAHRSLGSRARGCAQRRGD